MPRRARLAIAGIPWHIIQRGNNRSACFFDESDYRRYLDTLRELSEEYECAIHAYVLMTNHVHLLLTPSHSDSPALLMKNLGQRYVQYINRTYGRTGTLWEGRFRSCLAQQETYLLTCQRYIELNPVRAGMVEHPRAYRWSSYRANAEGRRDELVTPHEQYHRLGRRDEDRRKAYRLLFKGHFDADMLENIRSSTNGNFALGNDRFREQIEKTLGKRVSARRPGRPKRTP